MTRQEPRPECSLEKVDLFSTVDGAMRQELEHRCTWRWWKPSAIVVGRNAASTSVYFVASGRCRVENLVGAKRGIVLDEIGAGGYFGEIGVIDGEPRSASVIAIERTLTAELERDPFMQFILAHPPAAVRLMQRLTEVIRQADSKIMELCGLDAHSRIYSELLRRAKTGGGLPANVARIQPIPVHKEIAARVSTTRETVARALADLTRRQLVQREQDSLIMTDIDALSRMIR